ncbi:hypothetical protein GCM10027089_20460 [Nocardia thraciensis]
MSRLRNRPDFPELPNCMRPLWHSNTFRAGKAGHSGRIGSGQRLTERLNWRTASGTNTARMTTTQIRVVATGC